MLPYRPVTASFLEVLCRLTVTAVFAQPVHPLWWARDKKVQSTLDELIGRAHPKICG